MLISQSTIEVFDRCRRKWWLRHYRELGRSREYTSPTTIGDLVHDALAQYYEGVYGDREAFVEPIQWVKEHAIATIGEHPEHAEDIAKDAEMAGIMVDGYMAWLVETGADSNFEHVEPEREIRAHLTDDVELIGKLDGKVHTKDGWTGILEHKTVGNFVDLPSYAQLNRQFLTYSLLELLEYLDGGQSPEPTAIPGDVARTQSAETVAVSLLQEANPQRRSMVGAPQEPRQDGRPNPESRGRASEVPQSPSRQELVGQTEVGGTPSSSQPREDGQEQWSSHGRDEAEDERGSQGTVVELHRGRARSAPEEDVEGREGTRQAARPLATSFRAEGAILNMLRKVKRTAKATPPFYLRHTVHHNVEELRNHWRHVIAIAGEIQLATSRLDAGESHQVVVPPTPERDCRYSCQFFQICGLFDDGSDVESVIEVEYEHVDPMARYTEEADA